MKTTNLQGAALDWAVAKAEGLLCFGFRTDGERFAVEDNDGQMEGFMPSTDWAQGGPIIEREGISLECRNGDWIASYAEISLRFFSYDPLVSAMRCYVASKLGEEVEIPAELMEVA